MRPQGASRDSASQAAGGAQALWDQLDEDDVAPVGDVDWYEFMQVRCASSDNTD